VALITAQAPASDKLAPVPWPKRARDWCSRRGARSGSTGSSNKQKNSVRQAISVLGDAREESTAKKTVEAAMQTFGQIDILINNTGVGNYKNLVDT